MDPLPVGKKQLIYAVCGYKNTGKTTVVTGVVKLLTARGYKVAVIKHDGHDFEGDVPGTDSFRHMEAGAYATAVFSPNRYLVHKKCKGTTAEELIVMFPEADIILIEGLKNCKYPKYYCTDVAAAADAVAEVAEQIEKLYQQLISEKS